MTLKSVLTAAATLATTLSLATGCSFRSLDALYAVPQASQEYIKLTAAIDDVRGNADYAAPQSGSNTQTVQLVDLDGDGAQEAISFFRDSAAEKPLQICIFSPAEGNGYTLAARIEGDGSAIDSVAYHNLGGSAAKELVVSWRISDRVRTLAAYQIQRDQVTELMRTGYSYYVSTDLDQDQAEELLVIHNGSVDSPGRVEFYDHYSDGGMALRSAAPLSAGVTSVRSYQAGHLLGDTPALFVTGLYGEEGAITDVFALKGDLLQNITLDEETLRSGETLRFYTSVEPTDINKDGVLELPQPQALKPYQPTSTAENFWTIHWRQYDYDGIAWPLYTTYHNYTTYDRWYLILPNHWQGNFTLSRGEASSATGERAVTFSYWTGQDSVEPQRFLSIYKLTGANRESRSRLGNRFILLSESDAVYAAEFYPCPWDCGLDEDTLRSRFDLIRTDWSTGR